MGGHVAVSGHSDESQAARATVGADWPRTVRADIPPDSRCFQWLFQTAFPFLMDMEGCFSPSDV